MAKHIVVDCEASGPCPQFGSMINFGAFIIEESLDRGFKSPIIFPYSDTFTPEAYASINLSYDEHLSSAVCELSEAMKLFHDWLNSLDTDRVVFWSDNPAFDWQWINHGFAVANIRNPFGFSARRIGDLYAGLKKKPGNTQGWKKYRTTNHDHDPLNDAKGNAEALIEILELNDVKKWLDKQK